MTNRKQIDILTYAYSFIVVPISLPILVISIPSSSAGSAPNRLIQAATIVQLDQPLTYR
jgi:hypothetical protein